MGRVFAVTGFALLLFLHIVSPAGAGVRADVSFTDDQPGWARFEGGWIDLRNGWGPAWTCMVVLEAPVECFRSAAEMRDREAALAPEVNCSYPLRLYDGLNQKGAWVSVYARGVWVNLSTLGFDNRTTSYIVGACSAEMASGANGGGSHYPGCLSPWCEADSMASGWNNVVSSVYLY
jgi:hypothetical protein